MRCGEYFVSLYSVVSLWNMKGIFIHTYIKFVEFMN